MRLKALQVVGISLLVLEMAIFVFYNAYDPFGLRSHRLDVATAWVDLLLLNLTITLAVIVFAIVSSVWMAVIATPQQSLLLWLSRLWAPFWAAVLVGLAVFFAW